MAMPIQDIDFETNKKDREETHSASKRSSSVGRAFQRLFSKSPDPALSLPPRQPPNVPRGRTPPRSPSSTLPPNNPYYRSWSDSLGGQSSQINYIPSAMASHRGITELDSSGGTGGRQQQTTQSNITCEIQELPTPIADVGEVLAAFDGEDVSGKSYSIEQAETQRSDNKTSPQTRSSKNARIAGRG